jgi:sec-independent protein translocase protein TatA
MGGLEPWHWVVVALVVAMLFGYKKLPDAARSLGRSLRIFKTEIKGMAADDEARSKANDEAEPKALPAADVVKRTPVQEQAEGDEVSGSRPRPSPSPNGRSQTPANTE